MTLQIVRDWMMKFNARGPAGLIDGSAPGKPRVLNGAHRAALVAVVESGLIPAIHGVVPWRIVDLCQWLHDAFQVSVSEQMLSQELRELGYRKLPARPRHRAQADGAIDAFKKVSLRVWTRSRASKASIAAMQRSGSATRPGSVRRTRSADAGPGRAPGPLLRTTSARHPPTSSVPSARRMAKWPG